MSIEYNSNIKVLDCTLRDGGYINDWQFGKKNIVSIIDGLNKAGVDYIETGFIQDGKYSPEKTLYSDFEDIKHILPDDINFEKLVGMIAYGTYPAEKIPQAAKSFEKGIRLIFKKHQADKALEYCKEIRDKGYKLFINPTFVDCYQDDEFLKVIDKINTISPFCMTLVDSIGALDEKMLLHYYRIIENNLDKGIALGFHSHNNLKLSFSNARKLMELNKTRDIIIDSSVFGMGRGAGNISTELLVQYLNDNYSGEYDVSSVHKLIDEIIKPVYEKTPWGATEPYHIAALNHCHPNYAKYLIEKSANSDVINQVLKSIPQENRAIYNSKIADSIYSSVLNQTL